MREDKESGGDILDNKELLESIRTMLKEELKSELKNELDPIKEEQKNIIVKLEEMNKQQKLIYEEVARTREDMTEVRADLRLVKIATVENSKDIEKLKVVK